MKERVRVDQHETQPLAQPDRPPDGRAPLPYRDWRADQPSEGAMVARTLIGMVLGAAAVLFILFVWVIANPLYSSVRRAVQWEVPTLVAVMTVAAIAHSVRKEYLRTGWRGLPVGMLIGAGFGLLLVGLCFVGAFR